jgi:hypothetical protein
MAARCFGSTRPFLMFQEGTIISKNAPRTTKPSPARLRLSVAARKRLASRPFTPLAPLRDGVEGIID